MKKLLFITLMLAFGLTGFSQITYVASADGDWNSTGTWTPAGIPVAGDLVTINAGIVVVVPVSYTAAAAIVNVGDGTGNGVLTVNGDLNVTNTAGLSVTVVHANSQLTVNGTLTYTGDVDVDAGILNVFGTMEYVAP